MEAHVLREMSLIDRPVLHASYNHKFLDALAMRQEISGLETFVPNLCDLPTTAANPPTSEQIISWYPEIEDALETLNEAGAPVRGYIVDPALIAGLSKLKAAQLDVTSLAQMCREINSSYTHGNVLATVLLMRTGLNHVPPAFGNDTFAQVLAGVGKSLKESFEHLENGLRKIADFHAHRKIGQTETYPSMAQVEPFKPQFELLLQQVVTRAS